MSTSTSDRQVSNDSQAIGLPETILRLAIFVAILGALLLGAAGRLDWAAGWAYLVVYFVMAVVSAAVIFTRHPDLATERANPADDAKEWDRRLVNLALLLWPLTLIIAGLDYRNDWSPVLAGWLQWGALLVLVLGNALAQWAAISNKFYGRLVRIQKDRGHTVVTGGPYRFVRHPGYVGVSVYTLATALLLESLWALVPAVLSVLILVYRTAREDATLRAELDGYTDYARRVRYRLLPGIW